MRAVLIEEHGGPEVLRVRDVAPPRIEAADDVIVRVRACALNHLDLFARRGITGPALRGFRLPAVTGVDVAGVVEEVGSATAVEPGQAVLLYPGLFCGECRACRVGQESLCIHYRVFGEDTWGGLAELTKIPGRNVFPVPEGLGFVEAASVPVAFTTAWRMLIGVGELQAGASVLVLGSGGGVGSAAVRIAVARGARVFAVTAGTERVGKLEALGVELAIDRHTQEFREVIADETQDGVDMVINPVGGETWRPAIQSLTDGGRMMICGATIGDSPTISIREIYQHHRQILGAPLGSRRDFEAVLRAFGTRELHPVVDSVFRLEDVADAHRRLESGNAFGKVVVQVSDAP